MRSRCMVAIEVVAVGSFFALLSLLMFRVVRGVSGFSQVPYLGMAACGGYILADLASGLTHWTCDRFFHEDTPIIGRSIIFPFRKHHRDPTAMTHHGFFELTGNSCLGMVPILGIVAGCHASPISDAGLITFSLAMFGTNLFHSWAHSSNVPRVVKWLQQRRLILHPDAHRLHHTDPYSRAYCVTNGWMNGILDWILS